MITLEQYFGKWIDNPDATGMVKIAAQRFLDTCAKLEEEMIEDGVDFPDNPKTGDGISGEEYGGFRPRCCTIGAEHSSHKEGRAVDRYDPTGEIDAWCMTHTDRLQAYGIHLEHYTTTPGWSHWTDKAPPSGKIVFFP